MASTRDAALRVLRKSGAMVNSMGAWRLAVTVWPISTLHSITRPVDRGAERFCSAPPGPGAARARAASPARTRSGGVLPPSGSRFRWRLCAAECASRALATASCVGACRARARPTRSPLPSPAPRVTRDRFRANSRLASLSASSVRRTVSVPVSHTQAALWAAAHLDNGGSVH